MKALYQGRDMSMDIMNSVVEFIMRHFGQDVRAIHHLKTWPESFNDLLVRDKRAEVRRADRDFRVGDLLLLSEWDPSDETYTGRQLFREIAHITPGGQWGLPADLCVLSVR